MPQFIDSIEYTNTKKNKVTLDSVTSVSTVDASTLSVANAREAQHAVNADNAANATNATNAVNATNATNVTTNISGKAISSIFESDGTTVKNATNATNAVNATNATSATKAGAIEQTDTRKTNELPTYYHKEAQKGKNFIIEFKESEAIGLSGQSQYCQLITYAKWTDETGGNTTQVAVVDNNYFIRTSTGSTGWGEWGRLLKEGEFGGTDNATNARNIIPDENGAVNPLGRKKDVDVGNNSTAFGYNSAASGEQSIALGYSTIASGARSIALGSYDPNAYNPDGDGLYTTASGERSIALGAGVTALGRDSMALGREAEAEADNAVALGANASASAFEAIALGSNTFALGDCSTAIGYGALVARQDSKTVQLGGTGVLALSALRCAVELTRGSDKRDKTDIENITDALAFIEHLTPVTFVRNYREAYISDEDKKGETFRKYGMCEYDRASHAAGTKKGERRRCGLLAQEVVEAMQSVYGTDNYADIVNDNFHDMTEKPSDVENKYTLAYANLVPFLIGAIKELNAKLKALESKLATSSVADVQED